MSESEAADVPLQSSSARIEVESPPPAPPAAPIDTTDQDRRLLLSLSQQLRERMDRRVLVEFLKLRRQLA